MMATGYTLLPFQFGRFQDDEYLIVNESGEFFFLPREEVVQLIEGTLPRTSRFFDDLRSGQFIVTGDLAGTLDMTATRYRTRKRFIANYPIPEEILKALLYIKRKPPLQQAGANKWDTIPECADWDLLILSLKTVRNNLFHGGKHHTGPVLEPARDKDLLRYCLSIMKAIVPLMPDDVKRTFWFVLL